MSGVGAALLVGLCGGAGAAVRFVVDSAVRFGTLVVNVTGSLLIGVLAGMVATGAASPEWLTFGAVGFAGGYTTFSAASVEAAVLWRAGRQASALARSALMLISSVAACALGVMIGTAL